MITQEFKDKTLAGLKDRIDGEVLSLVPTHPNYTKFVEAVKVIIDWGLDQENGFVMEFNSDYTRMRKRLIHTYSKFTR